MKKIFSIILAIMCVIGVFSLATPISVSAAENEVLVIIQCNVDMQIGKYGREVMLDVMNKENYKSKEVVFYDTSNYRSKVKLPEGKYEVVGLWVSGSVLDDFTYEEVAFEAKGQTVNVSVKIGNGDWDGSSNNDSINGTIDKDKTDELLKEDNKNPVDWDKVDEEVEDIQGEIADNTVIDENPDTDTPSNDTNTEDPSVDTETEDKPNDKNQEDKGFPIFPIIFIVVVLGGSFGFIIYKRKKQGLPILPFGKEE